jgi:DNA topoisomerase-1
VRAGRYGPYVNHGKVNATLPRNVVPEDITLEQALVLLSAKEGQGGGKAGPEPAHARPASKPAAARKAPAKTKAKARAGSK